MAIENLHLVPKEQGPNGVLSFNNYQLPVKNGTIYMNDTVVGVFFDDGLIEGKATPLAGFHGAMEELPGWAFSGYDRQGLSLNLPTEKRGPSGGLHYNNIFLHVICGRVCTTDHRVIGTMEDDGSIYFRDHKEPAVLHKMDENSQLNTIFHGVTSQEKPLVIQFERPLHRKEFSYVDNEIIRYFDDYDKVTDVQRRYVLDTMRIWAASGLLQLVRKSEGNAALGNVKHGAAGVTGVRTGMVTLDKDEFREEIENYGRFGAIALTSTQVKPFAEVRINLVVSHEYGHQLEFTISQALQDKVQELYRQRLEKCDSIHPLPEGYEGASELVRQDQIDKRLFISGYARASWHEYFAECTAAFSVHSSRQMLRQMDPDVHQILQDVIYSPEKALSPKFETDARKLQTSLRVGGELNDNLLDK